MVLRGGKGGLDSLHATDDSLNSGTSSAVIQLVNLQRGREWEDNSDWQFSLC